MRFVNSPRSLTKKEKTSLRSDRHGWCAHFFAVPPRLARDDSARILRRAQFHDQRGSNGIEKGRSLDEAVKRAKALGVTETDPAADLDGWDSAVKVAALAIALMGAPVRLEQVQRTGIRDLSEEKSAPSARPGCVTNSFAARNARRRRRVHSAAGNAARF